MIRMYDTLMKSGKFTANQNKNESGEAVDSIAELVAICESDGFIPRYYTDGPQDKVDKVILDMQQYTHNLVTEELGLGNLIESAIHQFQIEKETTDKILDENDEEFENALFNYEEVASMTDQDYADFSDFEDELTEEDYNSILEENGDL